MRKVVSDGAVVVSQETGRRLLFMSYWQMDICHLVLYAMGIRRQCSQAHGVQAREEGGCDHVLHEAHLTLGLVF